ncbi:FG-GAP repeat domain-containing protein [Anaeromyxobacter oryzae]|uniref:FG-GAP repeat protein n=1 Tax=Anaeromyxobacter oryzae TaxID=2918170 RepID=A0ABM7X0V5_9BACT|nr:VCBS repeat-containing protein [Anaeromyxobacter oryzae]BDG05426.1 hypothetical protein AMOR_44220 [Anaeromyxobacter oryzae]
MPNARPLACAVLLAAACSSSTVRTPSAGPVAYGAPELLWARGGCFESWCQTGWYASPALADLDGDGVPEVVWGASDVVALRASDGALLWRAPGSGRVWAPIAVADLDGDGKPEIVVGRNGDLLTVYGPDGQVRWSRNPFGAGELRSVAVADLDGDGKLEIVVGRASGGDTEQVAAYSAAGVLLPGFPARRAGEPGNGWGMYNQNLAIADLDGDGTREIVAPTDTHYVTALDRLGNQLGVNARYAPRAVWAEVGVHVDDAVDLRGYALCGTEHRPNFAMSAPAIGDLDGEGTKEIVVVGDVYDCGSDPYRSLYHMPFVLNRDRSRWKTAAYDWTVIPSPRADAGPRSQDDAVIFPALPNAVLADLDGDGKKEILFASWDGKVHAFGPDRKEHGAWPFTVPGPGAIRFASEPAVVDLDGDGQAEVIFASWPDVASGATGKLYVLDALGRLAYAVDLPPSFPAGDWNGGLGAPTVARLAPGGDVYVFLGTAQSGVVAFRIPHSAGARLLWPTGRGNLRRDGTPPA